jgi:membrane fusion protein, multidrug efflux system
MTIKRLLLGGIGLAVVAAAGAVLFMQFNRGPRADVRVAPPPVPVTAVAAISKTMLVRLAAIGNVEAYTTVAVKARIDGQINSVHFKEGDEVRKGDLLFEIDPRPLQATLAQAQANMLRDKALLDRAKAQEVRYKDLLEKKFISQDAYEQVRTNAEAADATAAADQAAIDSARLQLGFCSIRSPVTGYAGKIMIQEGNMLKANDAGPLVSINQVVPIYASFSVPEQNLGEIRGRHGQERLKVEATLANSGKPPVPGRITFIDNGTDLTTGTIKLKAEFPNTDKLLWPGQFVNIALILREQANATVVPSAAVQSGPGGQYVYVVKPDLTAELRNIKVARAEGLETIVEEGVAPGELVVTEGQLRLAQGTRVNPGKGGPTS